jgi:hypothetical protein
MFSGLMNLVWNIKEGTWEIEVLGCEGKHIYLDAVRCWENT